MFNLILSYFAKTPTIRELEFLSYRRDIDHIRHYGLNHLLIILKNGHKQYIFNYKKYSVFFDSGESR
jgi:hypothetical protein